MNSLYQKEQTTFLASALKGKTIFINGATGLIGSRIVFYLVSLNDSQSANILILCSYRNIDKKNSVFKDILYRKDVIFLHTDDNSVPDYENKIDYVIQAAGISGGSKMHLIDPIRVFESSYTATKKLLDFSIDHSVSKFLFVSSYEIYGAIDNSEPIKEDSVCNLDTFTLRNIYAEGKRICESLCTAYSAKYDIETFSGRLTSTFGSGVKYNDPRFFAEFSRCIIEGRDIVLKSSGGTIRGYLDADDAAAAFLFILANGKSCNAYNLSNMDNHVAIRDIAYKMISIADAPIKVVFDIAQDSTKYGFRKEGCTVIDATKIMSLGWKPVYAFEDTLQKLIQSMRLSK